jgi:hypothetical protein
MKLIINKNTGEVLFGTAIQVELGENEMEIDFVSTDGFIKPFINLQTLEIYEGATDEDVDNYNAVDIPSEVALWKLRFILSQMNLEQSVSAALETLPEPQKTAANYIWNYGNSIDRHSATIGFLQSYLGLSDTEVNQIFIQSNSITL